MTRPPIPRRTYLGCALVGAVAGGLLIGGRPGIALALAVGTALLAAPVLVALGTRQRVTLTSPQARRAWRPIGAAYANLLRSLPALHPMIELRPTWLALEHGRLDAAALVARWDRLEGARQLAHNARYGLPPGDPVRADLTGRAAQVGHAVEAADAEIGERTERLTALAARWAEFAYRRAAERRAARTSRRALDVLTVVDAAASSATGAAYGDPIPELAERTEAVLSAYRELTEPAGRPLTDR